MGKVNRFEDLKCWQAARMLVKKIYTIAEQGRLSKDFDTKSQIKRASLSTMSNIAEGFGKFSEKEFIRYLDISQSSTLEVKSILYVLEDLNYFPKEELQAIHEMVEDTRGLTLGLIKYLRNKEK